MATSSEPGSSPGLTTISTVRPGEAAGTGTEGEYFRLVDGPGETHVRRLDLLPDAHLPTRRRSLLHFAHLTDLHVLDPASPGRFEFAERLHGAPGMELLLPAYRPQEFLQLHACDSMMRTMNSIEESPVTGSPLQFLVLTGDLTDNAQTNELQQVLRLCEGGMSTPWTGLPCEVVASDVWKDFNYWRPSQDVDEYKRLFGFPSHPDLLDETSLQFELHGIRLPWLAGFGNHDALIQGTALPNAAYERILAGGRKPRRFPTGFDVSGRLEAFIGNPELFLSGPASSVTSDPVRRTYGKSEFLQAYMEASGEPNGHGFEPQNLATKTAYYVDDRIPGVRIIVLDTVNAGGHYMGSMGATQVDWLAHRLSEVHSRYWDASGDIIETGQPDRLVVLCSHHGLGALTNDLVDHTRETDLPRVLGPEVETLLHGFPNLVLWVNGHTHRNAVRPRADPRDRTSGFWEVTTSSIIDWPCQGRLVEIVSNGDGTLSILCTMVDQGAPASPDMADGPVRLASIHRELAANDSHLGMASGKQGLQTDRNVDLLLPAPFPLD